MKNPGPLDRAASSTGTTYSSLLPPGEKYGAVTHSKQDTAWLRRLKFFLFHLFCVLWIVPLLYMLVWNATTRFVGASAYCPDNECWPKLFTDVATVTARSRELNHRSHNLLGWLQLVAKALELWFVIIVSALVFSYYRILARKPDGLPNTYLFWPVNFVNIRSYFSVSLWSSAYSRDNGRRSPLLLFVILTILLGILCNIIGPAIAVLIIPSLQWIPLKTTAMDEFLGSTSASPPTSVEVLQIGIDFQEGADYSAFVPLCTEAELEAQAYYECTTPTSSILSSLMDQWFQTVVDGSIFSPLFSVGTVSSYIVNQTGNLPVMWAPNQQLLGHMSNDKQIIQHMSNPVSKSNPSGQYSPVHPPESYGDWRIYNRSLEMEVHREGPTFGATILKREQSIPTWTKHDLSAWTTKVDADRSIRCFPHYSFELLVSNATTTAEIDELETHTRCIRLGKGWSADNKQANFTVSEILQQNNKSVEWGTVMTITFSDRATFFPGTEPPSWLPKACLSDLKNGTVPSSASCDWDRFFAMELSEDQAGRAINTNTWEMARVSAPGDPVLVFDFSVLVNFTEYSMDPTYMGNPLGLVHMVSPPESGTPVVVDPAWALLSWGADNGGVLPPRHSALYQLAADMNTNNLSLAFSLFPIAIVNMLSLLRYTTKPVDISKAASTSSGLLRQNGLVYGYAYALKGRTSYFAFVVALIAVFVALLNLLIGMVYRIEQASINDFTLAALEHHPLGEKCPSDSDSVVNRARFRVEEDSDQRGGLLFRRTTTAKSLE